MSCWKSESLCGDEFLKTPDLGRDLLVGVLKSRRKDTNNLLKPRVWSHVSSTKDDRDVTTATRTRGRTTNRTVGISEGPSGPVSASAVDSVCSSGSVGSVWTRPFVAPSCRTVRQPSTVLSSCLRVVSRTFLLCYRRTALRYNHFISLVTGHLGFLFFERPAILTPSTNLFFGF